MKLLETSVIKEEYRNKGNKFGKFVLMPILLILIFLVNTIPVLAAEEEITSIQIDVLLNTDGSAVITEVWDVKEVYEGTEYYIAIKDAKNMRVTSLNVWDETGRQYDTADGWDVDKSFEEKAYRCGIIQNGDDYEICWGISSYDDHVYTVSYLVEGFVKRYDDYAGFYHRFVSDELSSEPEAVKVTIHMEDVSFSVDNSRIWSFGYEGQIEFWEDGSIVAYTEEEFSEGYYLNVLCNFNLELFPSAAIQEGSFEAVQDRALGEEDSDTVIIISMLVILAVSLIVIIVAVYFSVRVKLSDGTRVKIPSWKKTEVRSGIPFSGSLPAAYSAMKQLKQGITAGEAISAYLIRWEAAGYIQMEERGKKDNKKKHGAIVFQDTAPALEGPEARLYEIFYGASDKNDILSESKLKKWFAENNTVFVEWEESLRIAGENELVSIGKMEKGKGERIRFNRSGFEQAVAMLGFKRYLHEYTTYYQKMGGDHNLWGEYLEFAALFGISEQFVKDLELTDPDYYNTHAYGSDSMSFLYTVMMINHFSHTTVTAAAEIDGGGGSASFGGGGGFSGGGGGGSR